ASNSEPRVIDNEADAILYANSATEIPETFLVYPELGAIRARENNIVIHAYYNVIPEEISYRYHNFRNGKSCHIPEFTGYALQEGPCCNGCEDDIDVGCETFILMDQRQDGTEQFFLRKICKDVDGNVTVEDLMLDGETEYVVDGTPLSPEVFRDNCSATVFTREMWDLAPGDLASNIVTQKQCATTFLRHYVYDCDGKIKEVYDTTSDGLAPYEPVRPIEAQGALPSVVRLPWPTEGVELHEEDNGEDKRYWFSVRNPDTDEIGRVEFLSETPTDPGVSVATAGRCTGLRGFLQAPAAHTTGIAWFDEPNNQSKFTFRPNAVVKQMSMLQLDFLDLDTFESIHGLPPWHDKIVDEFGNPPLFVDNDEDALFYVDEDTTETLIAYKEKGAILNKVAGEDGHEVHVYAYYYD